jgi:hypothetical protein
LNAITLGIHGDAGDHEGGLSLVELATIHEFGDGHSPQRSFVRAWAEINHDKIVRAFTAAGREVGRARRTPNQVLDSLGSLFKASMQARISEGIEPPNAESTIQRKGDSSTPLVDKAILKAGIDYKIELG